MNLLKDRYGVEVFKLNEKGVIEDVLESVKDKEIIFVVFFELESEKIEEVIFVVFFKLGSEEMEELVFVIFFELFLSKV